MNNRHIFDTNFVVRQEQIQVEECDTYGTNVLVFMVLSDL